MENNGTWMASKDVAVKLNVHVRTLRNWIDVFSPYMVLQKNSQGHLLLSEQAYNLLIEIKRVKDSGVQTLKEIEEILLSENILPEKREPKKDEDDSMTTSKTLPNESLHVSGLQERIAELEANLSQQLYETLQEFTESYRQTAVSVEYAVGNAVETVVTEQLGKGPAFVSSPVREAFSQHYKDIMQKIEEIENKQDHIRLEMRKMNFELQMMNATEKMKKKQKKQGLLKWSLFRKAPQVSSEY